MRQQESSPDTTTASMAQASSIAMALASQTKSVAIPKGRDVGDASGTANYEKAASALLTPPNSISPDLPAHPGNNNNDNNLLLDLSSPNNIETEMDFQEMDPDFGNKDLPQGGMPLSKGALSNLDGAHTITPSMLAKHHLPGIMLGNGPRPIRYVMGELTQSVPGFSRIPPAKARRIVVAALESRSGGGVDGNVAFCKTGWGRWDAHVKGLSRDSGVGSFNEEHLSPPRSEHSSYAFSHNDSGYGVPAPMKHREHHSRDSWTASSLREEDEFNMDMDPLEEAADKMSLDGDSSDSSMDEETDEEDWAAVGVEALRKASLPKTGMPRQTYRTASIPYNGRWASKTWNRSMSASARPKHSSSVPCGDNFRNFRNIGQTPEEKAAVAALIQMGSM